MGPSASKWLLRILCERCVVDDVSVGVWELIFYLPLVFNLFVKGDVDWVDTVSCVETAVVGESVCIWDKSEGFILGYL